MVEKCDGYGKELIFLEGNICIPPAGSDSKRGLYCRKCYYKKVKEKINL
jgi:hypothetical protein